MRNLSFYLSLSNIILLWMVGIFSVCSLLSGAVDVGYLSWSIAALSSYPVPLSPLYALYLNAYDHAQLLGFSVLQVALMLV